MAFVSVYAGKSNYRYESEMLAPLKFSPNEECCTIFAQKINDKWRNNFKVIDKTHLVLKLKFLTIMKSQIKNLLIFIT